MKLINTIEISPYDYSKNEYTYPDTISAAAPRAWNNFWLKCLSDSNLENLEPIRLGSYLVDLQTISSENLTVILKKKLAEIDINDVENQVGKLVGGIVVSLENEIVDLFLNKV